MAGTEAHSGGMNRRHQFRLRRPVSIEIELYEGDKLVDGWDFILEQGDDAESQTIRDEPLSGGRAEIKNDPELRSGECYVTFVPSAKAQEQSPGTVSENFVELSLVTAEGLRANGEYLIEREQDGRWVELDGGPLIRGVAYARIPDEELAECWVSITPTHRPSPVARVADPRVQVPLEFFGRGSATENSALGSRGCLLDGFNRDLIQGYGQAA